MDRHTNLLLEDMAEKIDGQLSEYRTNTPVNRFLAGMCEILESHHSVRAQEAANAVKSAVAGMIEEGVLDRIEPLASGAEQASWIETAHMHGIFGRALTSAGVLGK